MDGNFVVRVKAYPGMRRPVRVLASTLGEHVSDAHLTLEEAERLVENLRAAIEFCRNRVECREWSL